MEIATTPSAEGPVFTTSRRVRHGHWGLFLLDGPRVRDHLDYPCGPLLPSDGPVRAKVEEAKRAWIERGEIVSLNVEVH